MSVGSLFSAIGEEDFKVVRLWAAMIVVCMASTSFLYAAISLYGCRLLIRRNCKWIFLPIGLTIFGALSGFVLLAPLAICIVASYKESGYAQDGYEFAVYCFVMVSLVMFFACGRKTLIYTM